MKNIRLAKRNYEIKIAYEAKSDPKGFFKLYRTKTRDRIGPLKTNTRELVETGEDMSQMMNEYFLSVFTQENITTIPQRVQVYEGEENDKLRDVIITRQVVQDEISRFKKSKSRGPDEVFPRVLKECKDVLSDPLADIFKMSVNSGYVPNQWKVANVTPIFKKEDNSATSTYRPISLTLVVRKMLESVIARSIGDHLKEYKLIHD